MTRTPRNPFFSFWRRLLWRGPCLTGDGAITEAREILGEEMTGIVARRDGSMQIAPAHLVLNLDSDGPETDAQADLPELPLDMPPCANDAALMEGFTLAEKGMPLMERLQSELRARLPERRMQLVQAYNLRGSEGMAQRRLKEDAAKGIPAAKSKLDKLEAELATLDDARDAAIAILHQEIDLLDFSPVTVYARALVLPVLPEEAQRRRDVQAEAVALKVTRDFEEAQGAFVEDVSDPNLAMGYDLRSHRPDGTILYIEVKGRAGLNAVHMTENEWRQAANHKDKYWLYTVFHCAAPNPQLHRVSDPFGSLFAQSGGVIIAPGRKLQASYGRPMQEFETTYKRLDDAKDFQRRSAASM